MLWGGKILKTPNENLNPIAFVRFPFSEPQSLIGVPLFSHRRHRFRWKSLPAGVRGPEVAA